MKTHIRLLSFALCISLVFCSFVSCESGKSKEKFTKTLAGNYFDTDTTITGYSESEKEFTKIADLVEERLWEYHKLYDAYHSKTDPGLEKLYAGITNIKDINALVDGQHVVQKVDKKLIDLLLYCKEIYELTDGETNVAMGSVLSLWHNERDKAKENPSEAALPNAQALVNAYKHTSIDDLIINEEESTVFLNDPEMLLDVGAVAKGYATEMIALELEAMGVSGYGLSVGGNVRLIGSKPGGEKWKVGIQNPFNTYADYVDTIRVSSTSVVTSGTYQRFYVVNGLSYHHIIDKDTLYPSVYFASVSVITKNSALADALSTALFSMSLESGKTLVEGLDGVEVIWVLNDGEVVSSSGIQNLK